MKANELMIGDWVFAVDCARPNAYRVTKVNARPENGEYPIHIDRPAYGLPYTFLDFDQVAPIPLTGEILEKNGFEFDGEMYKLGDSQLVIVYRGGLLFGWVFCYIKQLNYVHELQHALRLCGIEKNIEL